MCVVKVGYELGSVVRRYADKQPTCPNNETERWLPESLAKISLGCLFWMPCGVRGCESWRPSWVGVVYRMSNIIPQVDRSD